MFIYMNRCCELSFSPTKPHLGHLLLHCSLQRLQRYMLWPHWYSARSVSTNFLHSRHWSGKRFDEAHSSVGKNLPHEDVLGIFYHHSFYIFCISKKCHHTWMLLVVHIEVCNRIAGTSTCSNRTGKLHSALSSLRYLFGLGDRVDHRTHSWQTVGKFGEAGQKVVLQQLHYV